MQCITKTQCQGYIESFPRFWLCSYNNKSFIITTTIHVAKLLPYCYWKSAKSVKKFWSKKRTAFTKNRFLVFKPVRGPWFDPRRGVSFATWSLFFAIKNGCIYTKRVNDWICYLKPWCSCFSWHLLLIFNCAFDSFITSF